MQNAIDICVDDRNGTDISGRIYHGSFTGPSPFFSISQLLLKIEEIFDRIEYPAASTEQRVFGERKKKSGTQEKRDKIMAQAIEKHASGKKATFVVKVQYRQNATWQGQMIWSEKNEARSFRSALELIKLIDSATEERGC